MLRIVPNLPGVSVKLLQSKLLRNFIIAQRVDRRLQLLSVILSYSHTL